MGGHKPERRSSVVLVLKPKIALNIDAVNVFGWWQTNNEVSLFVPARLLIDVSLRDRLVGAVLLG